MKKILDGINVSILHVGGLTVFVRPDSWDETILTQELLLDVYKVGSPKVVVDIGAHVGGTALVCAQKGATVYAYEPSERNFGMLVHHIIENKLEDKIHPFKLAVSGSNDTKKLYHHETNFGCYSSDPNNVIGMVDEYEYVDCIKIQDIFKDIEHCDLLKIDCEGAELEFYQDIPFEKVDQISIELHLRDDGKIKELFSKHYNVKQEGTILICTKC